MNQQFVSIDSVFSKLIRSGRTEFNEDDIIEWCGEALEFIGAVRAYEEAIAFIEVKNHQCKLPLGLHKIIQVARNRNCTTKYKGCCPLEITQGCEAIPPSCITPNNEPVWLDCNGQPIVYYDVAYYRPYFDLRMEYEGWSNSSYYRQNFTPVRLANHTLFGTLVLEDKRGYTTNGSDEYTVILNNVLRTSFKEGQVCVAYYRQVRDPKTGYPMIPDVESYKTAINKYLLMQMAGIDFENGRDGAKGRLDKYESDWQWYCGQSADIAMMPSGIDEYQNLLDQRLKLIPNYNSYYKFFGNLSKPEIGYPTPYIADTSSCDISNNNVCDNNSNDMPISGTTIVYWGVSDTDILPSETVILSSKSGTFSAGANIIADFRSNTKPKFLWMAEKTTEPVKTKWYGSPLNGSSIGVDEAFAIKGIQGTWRVYMSSYETRQTQTTIQFQVS